MQFQWCGVRIAYITEANATAIGLNAEHRIMVIAIMEKGKTMRLIDADQCWNYFYEHLTDDGMTGAINAIEEMPTVDAVPVVRCKDCKYKQGSACDYSAVWVRPNGFCSWGERKEE